MDINWGPGSISSVRGKTECVPIARRCSDGLGFIWDVHTAQWEEGFEHLQDYVKEQGDCRVRLSYVSEDGFRLGAWVNTQRTNEASLSADRKSRLNALGFIWDALTHTWEEGFQHLQEFLRERGHCNVRYSYKAADGFRLGAWVNKQRQKRKTLSAERKARLEGIGFIFDPRAAAWEEGFRHLQDYVNVQGDCRVQYEHVTADEYRLGQWVQVQRRRRKTMSAEQRDRLDSLGFVWDVALEWEEGFQHLEAYVHQHGDCRVRATHIAADGYRLGQWVKVQRRRQSTMPVEQKDRLQALGFVWDALADEWEEGFQHLQAYANEHGHCRVKYSHVTADGYRLGQWVQVQRRRESTMPTEQKDRLDALGFEWSVKKDAIPRPRATAQTGAE